MLQRDKIKEASHRFCSFHTTDIDNLDTKDLANATLSENLVDMHKPERNVSILPDGMTWIPEHCKSGWMKRNNFSFNIAIDDRDPKHAILQKKFDCENSFKQ